MPPGVESRNGLLYVGDRLIMPNYLGLHEDLFQIAHDKLGHFGMDKTYAILHHSYYWPNMHWDLIRGYIPLCQECQRNKLSTSKPVGLLHSLLILESRFGSVTLDFIGPLPLKEGFDAFCSMTCCAGTDI